MATAFLTVKGVGPGQLVRAGTLARALAAAGEPAVIFSEGMFPLDEDDPTPGTRVPSLREAGAPVRRQITADLRSLLDISLPATLVEDTYPSPVRMPSHVRRVLVIGPTTFADLQRLHTKYRRLYAAMLLGDAPDSPTWPYTPQQTDQIRSWPGLHCIGPVSRWATSAAVADAQRLRELIVGRARTTRRLPLDTAPLSPMAQLARPLVRAAVRLRHRDAVPLAIRVDDVVSIDSTVDWLLRLLASRRLPTSLEVVPYLVDFDERRLQPYDPDGSLFAVSQHGYAHVPRSGADRRRYEFAAGPAATRREIREIQAGKARLETAFAARFHGGFSAPFDALPEWLPSIWRDAGGRFVSCLRARTFRAPEVPIVVGGWDVWDWRRDQSHSRRQILGALREQSAAQGSTGIALHPRCLRSHVERRRLVRLLDFLQDRHFVAVPLADLAQRASPPAASRLAIVR